MPQLWSRLENSSAEESRCGRDDFLRSEIRDSHAPAQGRGNCAKGVSSEACCGACSEAIAGCCYYPQGARHSCVRGTVELQFSLLRPPRGLHSRDGQYSCGEDLRWP